MLRAVHALTGGWFGVEPMPSDPEMVPFSQSPESCGHEERPVLGLCSRVPKVCAGQLDALPWGLCPWGQWLQGLTLRTEGYPPIRCDGPCFQVAWSRCGGCRCPRVPAVPCKGQGQG